MMDHRVFFKKKSNLFKFHILLSEHIQSPIKTFCYLVVDKLDLNSSVNLLPNVYVVLIPHKLRTLL